MGMELMQRVTEIREAVEATHISFVSNMKIKHTEGLLYLYMTNDDVIIKELN